MVRGLQDGKGTGASAHLIRQIHALGAKVVLASTGRVSIATEAGTRRVYALDLDQQLVDDSRRGHSAEIAARIRAADSPLSRALADLQRDCESRALAQRTAAAFRAEQAVR